jgi:short-subunit dehydrogenase
MAFIVLITGPSEGTLGGKTALFLAAGKPALLLLAGRNLTKIQHVVGQIKKEHSDVQVEFIKLDLASKTSVRQAAQQVKSKTNKLDILINNAGGKTHS